jgi:MFS family permease
MKVDKQLLSWIFSIYVLANLVGISFMAKLSDLHGRRKIYILSLTVFATGSLVVNPSLFRARQIQLAGLIAIGTGIFQSNFVFMPSMAINFFGVSTTLL